MLLNFNKPLYDLEGNPVKQDEQILMLNKILGNNLAGYGQGDPLKFFGWALKVHAGGDLDLDISDTELLRAFIAGPGMQGASVAIRAQLLQVLVDAANKQQ